MKKIIAATIVGMFLGGFFIVVPIWVLINIGLLEFFGFWGIWMIAVVIAWALYTVFGGE